MKVAIIGAGIIGTYLAWRLARKGLEVSVFEQKEYIGGKACSGLISRRLWHFLPESRSLVENEIKSANVHFPRREIEIRFSPRMLVIGRKGLEDYAAALAREAGVKLFLGMKVANVLHVKGKKPQIVLEKNGKKAFLEFDYIIGCDGANSVVRKSLRLREPKMRLGILCFGKAKKNQQIDVVEVFRTKCGFDWIIPRSAGEAEYGTLEKPADAKRIFEQFCRRQKIKPEKILAAPVPEGLVLSSHNRIALCGDAAGLTKSWSIDGEESVLIKENGLIKTERIKDVVKNASKNISALSPTRNLHKVDFFEVRSFLEHPAKEDMYEIILKKGYRVKASASHSVMTVENYRLTPKKVSELQKEKDYVPLTLKIPNNERLKQINLVELIIKEAPELIPFIRVKGGKNVLFSKQKEVPRNHRSYWRDDSIPLKLFLDKKIIPKNVKISYNPSHGLWLPNIIKITPEFCRILGYYAAEGDSKKGKTIHITFGRNDIENGLLDDLISCVKRTFDINTSKPQNGINRHTKETTWYEITFGGRLLAEIFSKIFKTGSSAKTKQIPYLIFNVTNNLKLEFLKSYINGDGTSRIRMPEERRNWSADISMKTVSRKLASDLIVLSFQLGLFPSIDEERSREHKCYEKKFISSHAYRVSYSREKDLQKLSILFHDKKNLSKYLSNARMKKSTVLLPKEYLPKDIVLKIKNKKLRKYFIDRTNADWCKGFDYEKVKKVLKYLDKKDKRIEFISYLIKNEIILLPIKEIKEIKASGSVYDLEIPETNMFVGGLGPIILHNSGGGVIWGLTAAHMLARAFPDLKKYESQTKRFFAPRMFFGRIETKIAVWVGDRMPFLLPRRIRIDSDWGI